MDEKFELSEEETNEFIRRQQTITRLKIMIGDASIELAQLEAKREELEKRRREAAKSVSAEADALSAWVNLAGRAAGADMDTPGKSWNVDIGPTGKLTFTRTA